MSVLKKKHHHRWWIIRLIGHLYRHHQNKNKKQKIIFFFTKTTYWIRYETKINIQFWIWIFIWFNGLLMNYRWLSSIRPVIAYQSHLILMTNYSIKNNATSLANDMIYWLDGVCLVIYTHTQNKLELTDQFRQKTIHHHHHHHRLNPMNYHGFCCCCCLLPDYYVYNIFVYKVSKI